MFTVSFAALPREVRTLLVLAVLGELCSGTPIGASAATPNHNSTCAGALSVFNVNGQSPCDISHQIYLRCDPGRYAETACYCNAIVYNLQNACRICADDDPLSWRDWAGKYGCTSAVPAKLPFEMPDTAIPPYAYNRLTPDKQFDVTEAVKVAQGWTPIQIAAPFISGVSVAAVALLLFLLYRRRVLRRTRHDPKPPAWKDAHMHSRRRWFGLLPGRVTVRKATVDNQWQIDQPSSQPFEGSPPQNGDIELFTHSRGTSSSRLLPDESCETLSSSKSSSFFGSLVSKISGSSRTWYTSGVDKSPEYKKVHVKEGAPKPGFKIDGSDSAAPSRSNTLDPPFRPPDEDQESHFSLPSVIDIRQPSRAGSISSGSGTNSGSSSSGRSAPSRKFPPSGKKMESIEEISEEHSDFSYPLRPPRSDFTLSTNELMTPIESSISGYRTAPSLMSSSQSAYPDSSVLPAPSLNSSPRQYRTFIANR